MNPQQQQNLEKLVAQAARDLPPRRAPVSLETRVQAEIGRRAAMPWWRKSFIHWPLGARAVFVISCSALIGLGFISARWINTGLATAQFRAAFSAELQWFRLARALIDTTIESTQAIFASISPLWLYGGATIVIALYVALFGLGAAAYRALSSNR